MPRSYSHFINLIERFLENEIDSQQFSDEFFPLLSAEPSGLPEDAYQTLDALCAEVDAFCDDAELFDPASDITEEQLREAVSVALEKLRHFEIRDNRAESLRVQFLRLLFGRRTLQ